MKKITLLIFLLIFISNLSKGQESNPSGSKFELGLQSWYSFTRKGFVQVRENQYDGAKLSFPDVLNMRSWGNMTLFARDELIPGEFFTFYLSWFYTSGKTTLPYSFYYNGTLIDGSQGLNIAPTLYFRARIDHAHLLPALGKLTPSILTGLVYDNMTFNVKGQVAPGSPRSETFEFFGRQAMPFPYLGGNLDYPISNRNRLALSVYGTHIPKFKSPFKEGGRVFIKYSMVETSFHYTYAIKNFNIGIGYKYSFLNHWEESVEDTNRFKISASGAELNLSYKF